ncbi:uncharacterized protein F4812DRAFT_111096 [Daldinia caldariorum]|uniref:uncharacterized protein n=1 Tax=Daldinia caldariorum TaxID=326644 RepID=UPI0020086B67|nr:uncharacterized protein F4812DRAFT_111096 [Daldinia caldariorum]KAI1465759.1 hypothetical protein F4812DRAFT_111096 [Daldinia caldariorum]
MNLRSDTPSLEEGLLLGSSDRVDSPRQAHALINHTIIHSMKPLPALRSRSSSYSCPPLSSIPQTSPERLALAATSSPNNDVPVSSAPSTVLYLAYGSNLSAETFLGKRRIRPLSKINVSVPTLDLTFDLPGLAYWEPCFSNVSPRKLPKPPIPGDPPKPPHFPPPPSSVEEKLSDATVSFPSLPPDNDDTPSWSKGLYGVVYEVTRDDYAQIVRTEGAAYREIVAPCLALPPPFHVPEKPPIPELPRPFLARTLYAPRIPSFHPPSPGDDDDGNDDDGGDDDDDGKKKRKDKIKRWCRKLLLPATRGPPGYAQPSARYLGLLRDGAREHYLPEDYQAYLGRVETYTITTRRQAVGRWVFLLTVVPLFALLALLRYVLAGKDGGIPRWLDVAMTVQRNLMWKAYDGVFKPLFGDGERTVPREDEDDGGDGGDGLRSSTGRIRAQMAWGSEKSALLRDW